MFWSSGIKYVDGDVNVILQYYSKGRVGFWVFVVVCWTFGYCLHPLLTIILNHDYRSGVYLNFRYTMFIHEYTQYIIFLDFITASKKVQLATNHIR